MNLTSDQKQAYFAVRLPGQKLAASGRDASVRCPFHADRTASLSVNVEKGAWKCHAGCGQGGIIEFEKRYSSCDAQTAAANVAEICGLEDQRLFRGAPEATYEYVDEDGSLLFEKLRYPGKRFSQRARDEKGNWIYNLTGVRKALYRLPEVITASTVAITEGEKDANSVRETLTPVLAREFPHTRFAATTNFDGAGKWSPEYSRYFSGKHVVIFPDNDAIGRKHALNVAASVFPYAVDVRVVNLPGLPDKGDVSDYLQSHSGDDLLIQIAHTPRWEPPKSKLLIPAPQFLSTASPDVDWLVDGVIQRGSNGFFCALPKVGKSWAAVDLALSLALGMPWIGFNVPCAVKTALVTREDNPALTKWRMRHLLEGKGCTLADVEGRLFVNSREQSEEFRLDKPELLAGMIAGLKEIKPEFLILDVFNILHCADENDNTEMRAVLEQLNVLQREVGCSIGVVHHFNKTAEGSMTQRLRGSSAIAGWAEWLIGIEAIPGELHNRKMQFELKAASQPDPILYRVNTDESSRATVIERVEWDPEKSGNGKRRRADALVQ